MPRQTKLLWTLGPPLIRGVGRLGFSLSVQYEVPLPPAPFVVAANHYSHLDPPVLASVLDIPIRYLAIDDLFGVNRMLDWLITGFGAIPTPRDVWPIRAVRTSLEALKGGEAVAVFPEATRVTHWGVLPPKRGAAWLARKADVPLIPAAILGTGRALGLDNKLHRATIKVIVGKALEPTSDDTVAMERWSDWITRQISNRPESEIEGSRRSFHDS